MGIGKELKKRALGVSAKAMEKLMADEKRAMKIANAIGSVQRGKQALDKGQEELMRTFQFAEPVAPDEAPGVGPAERLSVSEKPDSSGPVFSEGP